MVANIGSGGFRPEAGRRSDRVWHRATGRWGKAFVLFVVTAIVLGLGPRALAATIFTANGDVTNAVTSSTGTVRYDGSFTQSYLGASGNQDLYAFDFNASITETVTVPEWILKAIMAKLMMDLSPNPQPEPAPYPPPSVPSRSIAAHTGNSFSGTFGVSDASLTLSGTFDVAPTGWNIGYDCTFWSPLPNFIGSVSGVVEAQGMLKPVGTNGVSETVLMALSAKPPGGALQSEFLDHSRSSDPGPLMLELMIDATWEPSYGAFPFAQTFEVSFSLAENGQTWTASGSVLAVSIPEIDPGVSASVLLVVTGSLSLLEGRRRRRTVTRRPCD